MKEKPIFVFGCRKSGTTMTAKVLEILGVYMGDTNELVNSHGELFFQRLVQGKLLRGEAVNIENEVETKLLKGQDVVWGVKSPSFAYTIDRWLEVYPQARLVRIFREWKPPTKRIPHRTEAEWLAQRAEVTQEFFTRIGRYPTVKVVNLYYDTFVLDPLPEIVRIANELELTIDENQKQLAKDFIYPYRSSLN